jgi:hypothetical protein
MNEAARVVERAMEVFTDDKEFVQFAGYIYSRLAQDLLRTSLDRESAKSYFRRAVRYFWDSLKGDASPELASRALRGLCIAAQYLDDRGLGLAALRDWRRRSPEDPQLKVDTTRPRFVDGIEQDLESDATAR